MREHLPTLLFRTITFWSHSDNKANFIAVFSLSYNSFVCMLLVNIVSTNFTLIRLNGLAHNLGRCTCSRCCSLLHIFVLALQLNLMFKILQTSAIRVLLMYKQKCSDTYFHLASIARYNINLNSFVNSLHLIRLTW